MPIEALEARKLMTISPSYTDVSQIAALTPPHAGFTNLYINFDGGTVPQDPVNNPGGAKFTIRPFEKEVGDGSLNRERDIQDILYEVSEVYAPFNVSVHRAYLGSYGTGPGDTTVFVGGNQANSTTTGSGASFKFTKYTYAETLSSSLDSPRPGHTINSDPYDVAFVDPVVGSSTNQATYQLSQHTENGSDSAHVNIFDIVRSIAHEAGHTFGLSHVRTDGQTDPTPLGPGTVNDVMSYDSANQFFADQNLNLTADNNSGTTTTFNGSLPSYQAYIQAGIFNLPVTVPFKTQNSYLTLDDVLGVRAKEQYGTIVNNGAVDSIYTLAGSFGLGPGGAAKGNLNQSSTLGGIITRAGDSQVFTLTTPTPTYSFSAETITVQSISATLRPEVLVYDSTGKTILNYADPSATGTTASLTLQNGTSYQIVVTSQDENSSGFFSIKVGSTLIVPPATTNLKSSVPASTANVLATVAPTNTGPGGLGAPAFVPLVVSLPQVNLITVPSLPAQPKPSLI